MRSKECTDTRSILSWTKTARHNSTKDSGRTNACTNGSYPFSAVFCISSNSEKKFFIFFRSNSTNMNSAREWSGTKNVFGVNQKFCPIVLVWIKNRSSNNLFVFLFWPHVFKFLAPISWRVGRTKIFFTPACISSHDSFYDLSQLLSTIHWLSLFIGFSVSSRAIIYDFFGLKKFAGLLFMKYFKVI